MLRERGEAERHQSGGDGGRSSYEQAVEILRREDVPLLLAHTVRHLGDVHRHAARFDLAATCYDEAVALYRSHRDAPPLDLANALRSAAVLYEKTDEKERAREFWEEARRLYEACGVVAGVDESAVRLARLS